MRTILTNPSDSKIQIDAFTASVRDWLTTLLVWLVETLERIPAHKLRANPMLRAAHAIAKRHVAQHLRDTARELRQILVAHAVLEVLPNRQRRRARTTRPLNAPRGFRHGATSQRNVRQITAGILPDLHRGSLRERAARLHAILSDLTPYIIRVVARFKALLDQPKTPSLILIHAHDHMRHVACIRLAAHADTS